MDDPAAVEPPPGTTGRPGFLLAIGFALLVGCVVFLASLVGIWSRPQGFMAAIWPANAILLGMMGRWPRLSSKLCWVGALAGFVLADMAAGSPPLMTFWMTLANMAGVFTGWILFLRLEPDEQRLHHPAALQRVLGICAAAAAASALIGGGAATALYSQSSFTGLAFWFTGDLVTYILLMPLLLTWPEGGRLRQTLGQLRAESGPLLAALPMLALAASLLATLLLDGPGVTYYPIPALVWCALAYPLFLVSLLTLVSVGWAMVQASSGLHTEVTYLFLRETISMRMGLVLLALAPLSVASINAARNRALSALEHTVNHDPLTGAMRRQVFLERTEQAYAHAAIAHRSAAAIKLGLDDFRLLLEQYGYWTGDSVLQALGAQIARQSGMRGFFGRLGEDEFGLLLLDVSAAQAAALAERLRQAVENMTVTLDDGSVLSKRLTATVSLAWTPDAAEVPLDRLRFRADAAMYRAREAGGNRVETDA